jgi:hypothetical protein
MKPNWLPILAIGALFATAAIQPCEARVVKFVVEQTTPYLGGADWGKAGPYDLLTGTAYMEVDPRDRQNRIIVDLDNAPRNAKGMVEFSTPFFVLKPADMARGNNKLFYALNNRGNSLEGLLTATTTAQVAVTDAGAAMERGYTIVDAGWEGDLVPAANKLGANLPVAHRPNGRPITGTMRYEYYDRTAGTFTTNLEGTPGFRAYPAADTNTAHATLTVRDEENGRRVPIPPHQWAFGTCPTGKASLVPDAVDLCYFPGFDPAKIYEVIYQAQDPIVLGLGFAATRDVASFLRRSAKDDDGTPNPLGTGIKRAYAAGGSQTGGYLRDYIYLGFNEDENQRQVFDGIIPWIAGTDRVLINVRFADPNAYSEQDHQHDYLQNSYPPFTYAVTTDPLSGIHDGILKRPDTDPLVMQVDSESEFWQLHDSLNVANGLGRPVAIPPNARLYFVGNTAHGFVQGGFLSPTPGTSTLCDDPLPGSGIGWETLRASLINLDKWADQGIEPPASNYPSVTNDTLTALREAAGAFPRIPGYSYPTVVNTYELLNFGPFFTSLGGALTIVPPRLGPDYAILVPKTDGLGIQLAGVHPIESRAPIGTSTGWNIRSPGHRSPNLCSLTGSYFPFATTKAERKANGDPRPSLRELYGSHAGFVSAVRQAAHDLVEAGFLLREDAKTDIAAAEASTVLQ